MCISLLSLFYQLSVAPKAEKKTKPKKPQYNNLESAIKKE